MFYFVVRRLRWLARVPSLPLIFDSLLLTWVCATKPSRLKAMEMLEAEALQIPGVQLRVHRFGGMEFFNTETKRELGHLHGHGLLDVRTGRENARKLIAAGQVRPHHIFPDSAWISFPVKSCEDIPFALELLQMRQRKL
ncbi:MAG: luciferase family protein [Chthoniobacterales bacterium]